LDRFCLIHPCDGQTDRRTDGRTELRWLRRAESRAAFARNNPQKKKNNFCILALAVHKTELNFGILRKPIYTSYCVDNISCKFRQILPFEAER